MKGIIWNGTGAELVTGLEVRAPGPTEVIVRVVNAGVCHSDVSVIDGTIPWPAPAVLGHEGAGIVEEIGSAVTAVAAGDHVVIATLASCGQCDRCNTGFPTYCRRSIGNRTEPFTLDGAPASNFAACSVFAERTVVSAMQCVRISPDMPLATACLIGCGVLTGTGSVWNRARVQLGETAVVFGVGGVGLNVIQALRISGASKIIAVDTVPGKEAMARQFGATHFIDARDTDVVSAVRDLCPASDGVPTGVFGAGGVNWVFDCVGHPAIIKDGMSMLDWGGNVVIIGVPPPTAELNILVGQFAYVDRGIMGCRYGMSRPHLDIPRIVDLYEKGHLLLDELVSEVYPMERFDDVIRDMHEGKLARGVLTIAGA